MTEAVAEIDDEAAERSGVVLGVGVVILTEIRRGRLGESATVVLFEKDLDHRLLNNWEIEEWFGDNNFLLGEVDRKFGRKDVVKDILLHFPVCYVALGKAEYVEESGNVAAFLDLISYEGSAFLAFGLHDAVRNNSKI